MEEKGIAAALVDELLNTVIHKFQIPGSGTQLKVQATAIKELMLLLEKHSSVGFPQTINSLVDTVKEEMPACFGTVPQSFYQLRRAIEAELLKDEFLKHVVKIRILRGNRTDLYTLIPVLKHPQVPEELKNQLMEGGMLGVLDRETLDSVREIIDEMGGENKERMKAYVAFGVQSAAQGDEIKDATLNADWERLRTAPLDMYGMMEAEARADNVLDQLFRHYLSKLYDSEEVNKSGSLD